MLNIYDLLGNDADNLLNYTCQCIPQGTLTLPSKDFVDRVFSNSDRNNRVLRSLQTMFSHGRLADTGYLSILPVDQGVEHTAGASFSPNPIYFDPENIIMLAIESGCSAVASSYGVLSLLSRKYAHKIPFILKLNHNELLSYPTTYHQIFFSQVESAYSMGAIGVGATIYFGSETSSQEIVTVSQAFARARELGLATILWCYLRNSHFIVNGIDYHSAADLTGQANHLGVPLEQTSLNKNSPHAREDLKLLTLVKLMIECTQSFHLYIQ